RQRRVGVPRGSDAVRRVEGLRGRARGAPLRDGGDDRAPDHGPVARPAVGGPADDEGGARVRRRAVLGARAMGGAAPGRLARPPEVDLLVVDVDAARAARVAERAGARARALDPDESVASVLKDISAVAACLPYRLNLEVMESALAAGTHYADLG